MNAWKVWIEKFRMRRLSFTFAILATLSAGILIGSVMAHGVNGKEASVDSSDAQPLQIPSPVNLSTDFTKIAKEVGPAVVNINTVSYPKNSSGRGFQGNLQGPDDNTPDGDGQDGQGQGQAPGQGQGQAPGQGQGGDNGMQDFFNHFFGFGGPQGPEGQAPDGGEREALGSGFIVDPHGYIITNNHVIDKADKINVKLTTDPVGYPGHPAKVVGIDKDTDIAVLKITVDHPLPTIKLGNSDGTEVGDWVIAIGSPFGLNQTVTAGIISSKNRSIEPGNPGEFQHFLQTDAAINPGNSGGPLVNMDGQVIGMNTAIYTQSAGNEGIGFAMPANSIANVYNQLIGPEHKVVRGSIGISFQSVVSPAVAHVYGFKNGVIISSVQPGFPAAKAGLKAGDIIVSIDGRPVKDGDDLISDIASRKPGSTATLGYIHNGKQQTATITIANRADMMAALNNQTAPNGNSNSPQQNGTSKLGISVSNVPPEMASKAGITGGVLIQGIRPGSFADSLEGLAPGEVILQMNRQPITNVSDFQEMASKLKSGDDVVFLIVDPEHANLGNTYVGGTLP
ncbi:MAG: trypsin-like peptidase domain-containing protein [Acidobacteriaceae bacterium]